MAWPKRGTRTPILHDGPFLWPYDSHRLWCSDDGFTVGKSGRPFVLFIEPFPFALEIRPRHVANALRWALPQGWTPSRGRPAMSYKVETE